MKRISGEDEFRFSFDGYRLPYEDDWRRQYNFYYQGCEFKTDKSSLGGGGCECRTFTFKHFRLRSNITNERIKTSGGGAAGPIRNPDE